MTHLKRLQDEGQVLIGDITSFSDHFSLITFGRLLAAPLSTDAVCEGLINFCTVLKEEAR